MYSKLAKYSQDKFSQMTIAQLSVLCCDNTYKRRIAKSLCRDGNWGKIAVLFPKVVPAFIATNPKHILTTYRYVGDRQVVFKLSRLDEDYAQLYQRINETHFEAQVLYEAQALFSIDHNICLPQIERLIASLKNIHTGCSEDYWTKALQFACKLALMPGLNGSIVSWTAWIIDVVITLGGKVADIKKFLTWLNRPTAQVFNVLTSSFSILASLSYFVFRFIPDITLCTKLVSQIGSFSRGITSVWQLIDKVMKDLFPVLYHAYSGYPLEIEEAQGQFNGIKEWYDEVQELVRVETIDEIARDRQKCTHVEGLYRKGLTYLTTATDLKMDSKILSCLNIHFGVVRSYYDKVQASGAFKGGPRVEPLVIHLHGASGVGKSGMMYPLAIDILKRDGLVDGKWAEEIYARNVEQQYWDNYKNQRITLYDDFGQMVDAAGAPNLEFFEIIRTGNLAPYPLHMASIVEKSRTYFNSKAVILSSNTAYFKPASLTHPEAVRRRIDISVQVSVKPEFRKKGCSRLDPDKAFQANQKMINTDVYLFELCDPMTGHTTDDPVLNYDQLVALVFRRYDRKINRTNRVIDELNERASAQVGREIVHFDADGYLNILDSELFVKQLTDSERKHVLALINEVNWQTKKESIQDFLVTLSQDTIQKLKSAKQMALDFGLVAWNSVSFRSRVLETPFIRDWLRSAKAALDATANLISDYFTRAVRFIRDNVVLAVSLVVVTALIGLLALVMPRQVSYRSELTASGDPKTVRQTRFHTELTASGDPRTMRNQRVRSELTASGDPKTQKTGRFRTEKLADGVSQCRMWRRNNRAEAIVDPRVATINQISQETQDGKAQLMADANAFDLSKKIVSNMYYISCYKGNEHMATVRGCFIIGRIFMTVKHLVPYIEQCDSIKIWNHKMSHGFQFSPKVIRVEQVGSSDGTEKDTILIETPRIVSDHPNILKSIITGDEISKFTEIKGVLLTPCADGVVQRFGRVRGYDTPFTYYDRDVEIKIRQRYHYDLETSSGDCGSVLIAISPLITRKLIGMHVAGATGVGIAVSLNGDQIAKTLEKFSLSSKVELNSERWVSQVSPSIVVPEGDFIPLGVPLYDVRGPKVTSLRASEIHGMVTEPLCKPAHLSPFKKDGKIFDPMFEGLKKCGVPSTMLNQEYLRAAVNDVKLNFKRDVVRQRVLSDWESVVGIEGDDFACPLKRSTAPGYPWKNMTKLPGKTEWFGKDEQYELHPVMIQNMRDREEMALRNERYPTIWTDTLKDERRPIEKVDQGKTRVFSAGPADFTLIFRKYFLGFAAHCAHNRNINEISVGTNVYSMDWTVIADLLSQKGKKVIAGDFSNFDGTLNSEILHEILEIVNAWYDDGEANAQIRRILWREICNSVHVCGGSIYMWTHSQPSGCPITAILNSIYNSIAVRYVYMLNTAGTRYNSMKYFRKHVSMVAYGDDNVLNISDEISSVFNQITMAEAFATFGMTYTDEAKTGKMLPYRTLSEVGYLKRQFKWDPFEQRYLAPIDINTCTEMVNWIRQCVDHGDATVANIENAAMELALHDHEIFQYWTEKMRQAANEVGLAPQILTFSEYRTTELTNYGMIVAKAEVYVSEKFEKLSTPSPLILMNPLALWIVWSDLHGLTMEFFLGVYCLLISCVFPSYYSRFRKCYAGFHYVALLLNVLFDYHVGRNPFTTARWEVGLLNGAHHYGGCDEQQSLNQQIAVESYFYNSTDICLPL